MIITLSGRRIDAPDATNARFPLEKRALVQKRLVALFKEQQATALVASAACGADLLALEIAGQAGIRRRIILPLAPAHFRATSVIDRPGEWGALYDWIIAEVQQANDLVLLNAQEGNDALYLYTNRVILDEAQKLAQTEAAGRSSVSQLLAVIVWEGRDRGKDDITLDFANEARARAIPVMEVLTV